MIEQQTRNKIALALTIILVPLMVYLLYANISKARQRKRGKRPPTTNQTVTPPPPPALPTIPPKEGKPTTIDRTVLQQQRETADRLPSSDPFRISAKTTVTPIRPIHTSTARIRVTGIIMRAAPAKPMAIINGKVMTEGQKIDEWKIIEIRSNAVVLDNGTERTTITVQ